MASVLSVSRRQTRLEKKLKDGKLFFCKAYTCILYISSKIQTVKRRCLLILESIYYNAHVLTSIEIQRVCVAETYDEAIPTIEDHTRAIMYFF